jgi:aryl sulfotransferase
MEPAPSSFFQIRSLPNVLLVHYSDLKCDMPGQIRTVAEFLKIPINESKWNAILELCSFEWMRKNATKSVPLGGAFWDAGGQTFIHKGVNGRWAEALTTEEHEELAELKLGIECARWLSFGACQNHESSNVD